VAKNLVLLQYLQTRGKNFLLAAKLNCMNKFVAIEPLIAMNFYSLKQKDLFSNNILFQVILCGYKVAIAIITSNAWQKIYH